MIAIVNYGLGNINAFSNIYNKLNIEHRIANCKSELLDAQKIILPGVGAFDFAIKKLNESGMRGALDELVLEKKVPVLGVCVGMQIMAQQSEEGDMNGLGWIQGEVRKINCSNIEHKLFLPHMGWNQIAPVGGEKSMIFKDINFDKGFYFLHSYGFYCSNEADVLATSDYGDNFVCAIRNQHIYGFQFHPEKSHDNGINLLNNFAKM